MRKFLRVGQYIINPDNICQIHDSSTEKYGLSLTIIYAGGGYLGYSGEAREAILAYLKTLEEDEFA